MKRKLALGLLWTLIAALISTPLWLNLSPPEELAVRNVILIGEQESIPLELPFARQPAGSTAHYRLTISYQPSSETLYLFAPLLNEHADVFLSGHKIDNARSAHMRGVMAGLPLLLALPADLLEVGENVLDLHLHAPASVRGYMSPLYVGSAAELLPHYRSATFALEYLRLMIPAGQLLVALLVLAGWLYRREEPLFGWLSALLVLSCFSYAGLFGDLLPDWVVPYAFAISMATGCILVIIALVIDGSPVPRWLKWTVLAIPASTVLGPLGLISERGLILAIAAPAGIAGLLIASAITARAAFLNANTEARLLLAPLLLSLIIALYDLAVAAGLVTGPVFLSIYYRPLVMVGIAMILMRRLGVSLRQLDNVNTYLTQQLRSQEAELQRLHREERREATERVRSEERQRLTSDLHDGLSGHLVSIIALSEREKVEAIERAAREALEDLRLVIHSLDISDDELPLALSGLRERAERQLRRLSVELDWSIVRLPEIAGVTPTHALNVLRIVQEAITNAIKHGQANRILIRGDESTDGRARIIVENDGMPFSSEANCGGTGLNNMRRRIHQLGGELEIEALASGTRLQLFLPLQLPVTS